MRLSELLHKSGVVGERFGDAELTSIEADSRRARPGAAFVCMPGLGRDSESFIPQAAAEGAVAAIVSTARGVSSAQALGLAALRLDNFEDALWRLCDVFHDHPTRGMKVVAVTGTNGKTTVASIVRDMLEALGLRSAYLGTLGFRLPDGMRELPNTTPFAVDLYNMLGEARDKGVQALAIEVSSHALAQRRAHGLEVDVAVFTNLSQDHLDFHGNMGAYAAEKRKLFTEFPRFTKKPFAAVLNYDDQVIESMAAGFSVPIVAFTTDHAKSADLRIQVDEVRVDRMSVRFFDIDAQGAGVRAQVALGGGYNVQNLVAAVGAVRALGYPWSEVTAALKSVRPVTGRFEAVPNDRGIGILVDYAHTPDALEKLLDAVRPLTEGQIITVFGCGGDRDASKRPLMARAASERSDLTVVTSDNPRTEDPQSILDQVTSGVVFGKTSVSILDRGNAVAYAIHNARKGDVVVIAGKGHENYQIVGKQKLHMDDRELVRAALAEITV